MQFMMKSVLRTISKELSGLIPLIPKIPKCFRNIKKNLIFFIHDSVTNFENRIVIFASDFQIEI